MKREERYAAVIAYFQEHNPNAQTELYYHNPFELLVAVVLSAQCTDKRVNMVTPALFEAFPSVQKMAEADVDEIFEYIKSVSYPNNKAKHLSGLARQIVADYGGEVPRDHVELMKLPGVGRKTANVMVSVLYDEPAMAVDTHVFRVANRIGLTNRSKTPLETERVLTRNFPVELIPVAHHWLILHGRYVCTARSPKCSECGVAGVCQYFASQAKKRTKSEEPCDSCL